MGAVKPARLSTDGQTVRRDWQAGLGCNGLQNSREACHPWEKRVN